MFSYTWERVWSVCVWVWVCVLRYLLACIYAWVNVYPTFYGDKLVKNWTGVLGQPALHGPHSPAGSPAATTYREGRAEQMLPSAMTVPKRPCPAGLLCELQAWLRPDWTVTALSQAHVYEQRHKKTKTKNHNYTMNYNTQGGSLFCIIPLPVVVKCPFWGKWNFNTSLVCDWTVINVFFLFSLIQQRTLDASLRGLSVSLFEPCLENAVKRQYFTFY